MWLTFVIILALAPLIVFKYTDFFLSIVQSATGKEFEHLGLTLPLGISFVTFTIISLLIDTARCSDSCPHKFLQTSAASYTCYADKQRGMTFLIWSLAAVIFRASSLDSAIGKVLTHHRSVLQPEAAALDAGLQVSN